MNYALINDVKLKKLIINNNNNSAKYYIFKNIIKAFHNQKIYLNFDTKNELCQKI
jgi:hypothetical protein